MYVIQSTESRYTVQSFVLMTSSLRCEFVCLFQVPVLCKVFYTSRAYAESRQEVRLRSLSNLPVIIRIKNCIFFLRRRHTGDTPFKCDICKKSFTRKEHYVNHYMWHTGKVTIPSLFRWQNNKIFALHFDFLLS